MAPQGAPNRLAAERGVHLGDSVGSVGEQPNDVPAGKTTEVAGVDVQVKVTGPTIPVISPRPTATNEVNSDVTASPGRDDDTALSDTVSLSRG